MQIFIKSVPGDDGVTVDEWYMIELQGELQFNSSVTSQSGKFVGDLHFTKEGTPIFIIGHHILYGKPQLMPKPFAILDKGTNSEGKPEYTVKALINRKLIFSAPPKPIVDNIHTTTT